MQQTAVPTPAVCGAAEAVVDQRGMRQPMRLWSASAPGAGRCRPLLVRGRQRCQNPRVVVWVVAPSKLRGGQGGSGCNRAPSLATISRSEPVLARKVVRGGGGKGSSVAGCRPVRVRGLPRPSGRSSLDKAGGGDLRRALYLSITARRPSTPPPILPSTGPHR